MKKLIYLLSISFLILQSCSSGDSDNNNSTTSVSDVEGNVYQTITICNQTWTKSNLNVSKYRNGDIIPQVTNPSAWANLTTGAWCYYNNNSSNETSYGKLYNWYAVNDTRGLAPIGWHIPSETEIESMIDCLGGYQLAGGKMKSTGTSQWASPNLGATNSSGFTGLPSNGRNSTMPGSTTPAAGFSLDGYYGHWWTNSFDGTYATQFSVYYNFSFINITGTSPTSGFAVRCVKN
jgi:uncharacterized protein (TIGR02145 family)